MRAFCDVVIYFFLFSFCGWVCESIFCSINEKKIVNRGFVSGPVCPIYGFGGLIVVYLLAPLQDNVLVLFFMGMIATTALEYVTSYILEKLFQTSWWDYSDQRLNINGRVCVRFSIIFGLLSVAGVKLLYPPVASLVAWIPQSGRIIGAWVSMAVFAYDCSATVYAILSLNGKLDQLRQMSAELKERFDASQERSQYSFAQWLENAKTEQAEKSGELKESLLQRLEQLEQLRERTAGRFQHKRLMNAFPHMKSIRNQEQFAELRKVLEDLKKRSRKEK